MSPRHNAAEAYLTSAVESAPPIKIIRMLYQGAIRFVGQAAASDPADPSSPFIESLSSADAIVAELRLALDPSHDSGEVVERLTQLYLFCESELQRAMIGRTHEPLTGVKNVLDTLLEAWTHVEVSAAKAA